jgi:hypothetical protein
MKLDHCFQERDLGVWILSDLFYIQNAVFWPRWIRPPMKKWRILLIFYPFWLLWIWYFLGLLHSKDIFLCYSISQMSINTTIFLTKLAFLYYMKRHTTETYLSPHINNANHFQHHWFYLHHCDTVIVVIMFQKSHNIPNCAFCLNHSSFCWHNFFSINRKKSCSELWSRYQQKFVENIRNGDHVFIHEPTARCAVRGY